MVAILWSMGKEEEGSRGCFSHQLSHSVFPLYLSPFPSPIDFLAKLIRKSWVRDLHDAASSVPLVRVAENVNYVQSVSFILLALVQES